MPSREIQNRLQELTQLGGFTAGMLLGETRLDRGFIAEAAKLLRGVSEFYRTKLDHRPVGKEIDLRNPDDFFLFLIGSRIEQLHDSLSTLHWGAGMGSHSEVLSAIEQNLNYGRGPKISDLFTKRFFRR